MTIATGQLLTAPPSRSGSLPAPQCAEAAYPRTTAMLWIFVPVTGRPRRPPADDRRPAAGEDVFVGGVRDDAHDRYKEVVT